MMHGPLTMPLVFRGSPLEEETQVGWYGTPLQVLSQQGRISEATLQILQNQSFSLCNSGACGLRCPVLRMPQKATRPVPGCQDEGNDVDATTALQGRPDSCRGPKGGECPLMFGPNGYVEICKRNGRRSELWRYSTQACFHRTSH